MHSLENRTRIQTKIGKVYTRFQTKTAQKAIPFRAAYTYKANVREYPPPPPPHGTRTRPSVLSTDKTEWLPLISNLTNIFSDDL